MSSSVSTSVSFNKRNFQVAFAEENVQEGEYVDAYGHPPCAICRNLLFFDDTERATSICSNCGCVQSDFQLDGNDYHALDNARVGDVNAAPFKRRRKRAYASLENNYDDPHYVGPFRPKSPPYKRATYFNELLSQWRCVEPAIERSDWSSVYDAFITSGFAYLNKSRVRTLLTNCDNDVVKHLISTGESEERAKRCCWFGKKYYEKWRTIRERLVGKLSTGRFLPLDVVRRLRMRFAELQPAFEEWRGGRKVSLSNYPFIFRRLLDLEGQSWRNVDWPPSLTIAKQRKVISLWLFICGRTGWPYINTDSAIFPNVKFYEHQF
jgi:hypothetical protein